MPATRTRKPRARKHPASQPPVLRLPWMDAYSAMRAVGLSWYAWMAEAEARLPGIVNRAGFDASLTVSRATAEAAKADAAAQAARAHLDVHSGRPIPEHMTGGCGEGDPGTSSVTPSPSSPWLPDAIVVPIGNTSSAWTTDEEINRHLEAIGYGDGPAPENGHTTTPSSTYTLDFPQPNGNGEQS